MGSGPFVANTKWLVEGGVTVASRDMTFSLTTMSDSLASIANSQAYISLATDWPQFSGGYNGARELGPPPRNVRVGVVRAP